MSYSAHIYYVWALVYHLSFVVGMFRNFWSIEKIARSLLLRFVFYAHHLLKFWHCQPNTPDFKFSNVRGNLWRYCRKYWLSFRLKAGQVLNHLVKGRVKALLKIGILLIMLNTISAHHQIGSWLVQELVIGAIRFNEREFQSTGAFCGIVHFFLSLSTLIDRTWLQKSE